MTDKVILDFGRDFEIMELHSIRLCKWSFTIPRPVFQTPWLIIQVFIQKLGGVTISSLSEIDQDSNVFRTFRNQTPSFTVWDK
jgi:hypothetical protein